MSIQKLAHSAYAMGKRPTDFAAAAQSNANAFWFYAVIAAIVWWFADWKWACIPAALAIWSALNSVMATLIQGS